jgi:predicted nicotinamide N-methyase
MEGGTPAAAPAAAASPRALHEQRCARSLARALAAPGERAFLAAPGAPPLRLAEAPGPKIGTSLWAGAAVLLAHLRALPPAFWGAQGARVVELGCGVGLAGLACSALGAQRVALTDAKPAAVQLAAHNVAANAGALGGRGGGVRACVLEWGAEAWRAFARAGAGGAAPVGLLVGSDLVYSEAGARALCGTLAAALAEPEGSAGAMLLAYKERGQGGVFFGGLAAAGLACAAVHQEGEHTVFLIRPQAGTVNV